MQAPGNIAIRAAAMGSGQLHVQAGCGVVADSVAQSEWDETMAMNPSARAVMRAAADASGASS